jgi:hypothetical protein
VTESQLVSLILSSLGFLSGVGSLLLTLRSAPTRVLHGLDAATSVARAATAEVAAMRDEWQGHRLNVGKMLDEAIDAMEQAEKKRRSARMQRTKAEEVRGELEAQPEVAVCPACTYPHPPNVICVDAAKQRFRAQGLDC